MANIIKTFINEFGLVLGAIFSIALGVFGVINITLAITSAFLFGFMAILMVMYKFYTQSLVNKNPFFLKPSDTIDTVIYYRLVGKQYVPVSVSKNVEYKGSLGYDPKGITLTIDETAIERVGKKKFMRALLVGDKRAVSIPFEIVPRRGGAKGIIPEMEEHTLFKKVERIFTAAESSMKQAAELVSQNVSPFAQFVVSGGIVGVAMTISMLILILAWNFAKDEVNKAVGILEQMRDPIQTNKILAQSLRACQFKQLGINSTEVETGNGGSAKEDIIKVLTGGG